MPRKVFSQFRRHFFNILPFLIVLIACKLLFILLADLSNPHAAQEEKNSKIPPGPGIVQPINHHRFSRSGSMPGN
jgi:hypothetical protein